jgi:L-threonylcarbamoyladenylate synthase
MSRIRTQRLGTSDAELARAAELLVAGELVALPTETVYGLAVRVDDPSAVARLYTAKGRPADNPLIVHVDSVEAITRVAAHVTPLATRLLARFSPGPLTVILEAHPELPRAVTAGLATVAVRIPEHPVALAVLRRCGLPLAAPSANRSGRPSPTRASHVLDDLDGLIAAVVDGGPTRIGLESTVVDARGPVPIVLREGSVTREDLGLVDDPLDDPERDGRDHLGTAQSPARAPGTRHRHYAPSLTVHVAPPAEGVRSAMDLLRSLESTTRGSVRIGLVTVGTSPPDLSELDGIELIGAPADAEQLAAGLFGFLRRSEDRDLAAIVIEGVAEEGVGRAIMDRLRRAAEGSVGSPG